MQDNKVEEFNKMQALICPQVLLVYFKEDLKKKHNKIKTDKQIK